jgi:hypothetical protein
MADARRELHVASRAAADIADAAAWYEAQRVGLSIEFIHALDQAFDAVAEHRPLSGSFAQAFGAPCFDAFLTVSSSWTSKLP